MTTTETAALLETFSESLNKTLAGIRDAAIRQMEYNLSTNLPKGIVAKEDAIEVAIGRGLASGVNKTSGWDCRAAVYYACKIMEDANCHAEVAAALAAAKRNGIEFA